MALVEEKSAAVKASSQVNMPWQRPSKADLLMFRLVIIDDNPDDRDLVRRFLLRDAEVRYMFLEADTGTKGVALCHEKSQPPPDCVILDLYLPDMDGLEVIEALKDRSGQLPFPLVVLTGSDGYAHQGRAALAHGAQDYLGKSWITAESLSRAVANAVERFRLTQQVRESEARFRHWPTPCRR